MRKYQRDYFRTRLQTDLNNAKQWEQVVGRELAGSSWIPGTDPALVEDVRKMMSAQRACFKDRRQTDLRAAKHYEATVDRHLAKNATVQQERQNPQLF